MEKWKDSANKQNQAEILEMKKYNGQNKKLHWVGSKDWR